jgi:DNA-binding transcriptional LysR family regulator
MNFDERLLNGIGVLAAVVRSGSFSSAATAVNLSQPGVSRAITRLEARLGVRLLERTTRSLTLTEEGRRLYERVLPLLEGLEQAATSVVDGSKRVRGKLRVNMHPVFAQFIQGPQFARFLDGYPDLQVDLVMRDQLGDMVADGFDVAIRLGEPRASSLIARKIWETRIITVAAPAYLKKWGRPGTPQDLDGGQHRFIEFRDPETQKNFQWEFHRGRKVVSVQTGGQLSVSDVGTLHRICLAGYGIAQVMEFGVEQHLAEGRLVDLFPDWPDERFPLYALYHSRNYVPAKTRAFLDFVISLVS